MSERKSRKRFISLEQFEKEAQQEQNRPEPESLSEILGDDIRIRKVTSVRTQEPQTPRTSTKKLLINARKQDEEIICLRIIFGDKFTVVDEGSRRYSILLQVRGAPDTHFDVYFHPEYPSDSPPVYNLVAPWIRQETKLALYQNLANIFSENFGKCLMHLWTDEILKVIRNEIRKRPKEEVPPPPTKPLEREKRSPEVAKNKKEEKAISIYAGEPIYDRGSSFSPYLAKVHTQAEVEEALRDINECKRVGTAWRNTYAYRLLHPNGSLIEFAEDGGEPKAGKNLLQTLEACKAVNVLVFISRRFGGVLLGNVRFHHLNEAANRVLKPCGFMCNKSSSGAPSSEEKQNEKKTKEQKKCHSQTRKSH